MTERAQPTPNPTETLTEEGEAFDRLRRRERYDVIVIGGGQAGLSAGYHLRRAGLRFVILDQSARIGDVWRKRWDSLRLFTPAKYDALDGLPFPAADHDFPTKDQMADYLESYAAHFELPVRCGVRVDRVFRRGSRYVVKTSSGELEADHVVVAMATFQKPKLPDFARELHPGIVQLHSSQYKSQDQLGEGPVLVAGAGNSGAEIAIESSRAHHVVLSGRDVGQVPFRIASWWGRNVMLRLVLRLVFHRLFTTSTPIGRKIRPKMLKQGGALIRTRGPELEAAGVERAGRTVGVRDGKPLLEDGRTLDVGSVIWCTGFHPGFSWIDLPVFDERGEPRHERGVAEGQPGLYFVGLHFQYAMSSTMIHGVGRDAAFAVDAIRGRIAERSRARSPRTSVGTALDARAM